MNGGSEKMIGGNEGINGDADFLSYVISGVLLEDWRSPERAFEAHDSHRRRAARSAILRARYAMAFGTVRGEPLSSVRNLFVSPLTGPFMRSRLLAHFSMETIPSIDLDRAAADDPRLPAARE